MSTISAAQHVHDPQAELDEEQVRALVPEALTASQLGVIFGMREEMVRARLKRKWYPSVSRSRYLVPWSRFDTIVEDYRPEIKRWLTFSETEPVLYQVVESEHPNEVRLFAGIWGQPIWKFRIGQHPDHKGKRRFTTTTWSFDNKEDALEAAPEKMEQYLEEWASDRGEVLHSEEDLEEELGEESEGRIEIKDGLEMYLAMMHDGEMLTQPERREAIAFSLLSIAESLLELRNRK